MFCLSLQMQFKYKMIHDIEFEMLQNVLVASCIMVGFNRKTNQNVLSKLKMATLNIYSELICTIYELVHQSSLVMQESFLT
jgi:hypothetical protein